MLLDYDRAVPAEDKPVIVMAHGVTDNGRCRASVAEKLQRDYKLTMFETRIRLGPA